MSTLCKWYVWNVNIKSVRHSLRVLYLNCLTPPRMFITSRIPIIKSRRHMLKLYPKKIIIITNEKKWKYLFHTPYTPLTKCEYQLKDMDTWYPHFVSNMLYVWNVYIKNVRHSLKVLYLNWLTPLKMFITSKISIILELWQSNYKIK